MSAKKLLWLLCSPYMSPSGRPNYPTLAALSPPQCQDGFATVSIHRYFRASGTPLLKPEDFCDSLLENALCQPCSELPAILNTWEIRLGTMLCQSATGCT
jgi:hypothetical protein